MGPPRRARRRPRPTDSPVGRPSRRGSSRREVRPLTPWAHVMGKDPTMSLRGRLLVAEPMLLDPNFVRTVVLLVEHTEEAAAGVVLNRPSETQLSEALPPWASRAATPPLVFVGGPVSPTAAVGLARPKPAADS